MEKYGDYEMVNGATVNALLVEVAALEAELATIKSRQPAVVVNELLREIVTEAHMAGQESRGFPPRKLLATKYYDNLFSQETQDP